MTGWLTVIQQMLGQRGLTNCFNSNQLLLLSGGTPHNHLPTCQRENRRHICAYVSVVSCVAMCVCVCVDWGRGLMGKKGDSHYPLCLVWGQTAGFNQLKCVRVHVYVCVCVSNISRDGDVASNASATVAGSRQPEPPLHRPRLSPPSYSPSISHCSLLLFSHPFQDKDKSPQELT